MLNVFFKKIEILLKIINSIEQIFLIDLFEKQKDLNQLIELIEVLINSELTKEFVQEQINQYFHIEFLKILIDLILEIVY